MSNQVSDKIKEAQDALLDIQEVMHQIALLKHEKYLVKQTKKKFAIVSAALQLRMLNNLIDEAKSHET